MMCRKPYITGKVGYGCGQCMPCRVNKRREWTHRIMLEDKSWPELSSFLTLTYEDKHVPKNHSLDPNHPKQFIRRWVRKYGKTRYFSVGEYGDQTQRPHYHILLFGKGTCISEDLSERGCRCGYCEAVKETWGLGHIHAGRVTQESAQYCAGYVTKKMTQKDDERLEGRHPEFARMSLRPGIGANFMDEVASRLLEINYQGVDVPSELRHSGKTWPLGRYLKQRLRERMGREKQTPEVQQQIHALQMSDLFTEATKNDKDGFNRSALFQRALSAPHDQQTHVLERRIARREKVQV